MGERRRQARCPWPEKDHYRYPGEAIRAAADATESYGRRMEAYACRCGEWHISLVKPKRKPVCPVDSPHGSHGPGPVPGPGGAA